MKLPKLFGGESLLIVGKILPASSVSLAWKMHIFGVHSDVLRVCFKFILHLNRNNSMMLLWYKLSFCYLAFIIP